MVQTGQGWRGGAEASERPQAAQEARGEEEVPVRETRQPAGAGASLSGSTESKPGQEGAHRARQPLKVCSPVQWRG